MTTIINLYRRARSWVSLYLDLNLEKEDNEQTVQSIVNNIEFKGTNLWVLIFAIFVASLGLNMNSIPVIIGAMLISPLMGPIMGIGLGLGTRDLNVISRSFKNLAIATIFGMLTSCFYFFISPIDEARSELLARTTPTIYDVLIAFFGGLAGIIATGSKQKGNVLPGVAIATALMPPLCTSGYGLATGQWNFFFGAFYLYMINCVYICFATWLGVRILHLPKQEAEENRKKRMIRGVSILILLTALPSVYTTYQLLKENIRTTQINNFVTYEFDIPNTQVVNKKLVEKGNDRYIEVSLLGQAISQDSINIIASKMHFYGLNNMELKVVQGYSSNSETQGVINNTIVQSMMKHNEELLDKQRAEIVHLQNNLSHYKNLDSIGNVIAPEMRIFFPEVIKIAVANTSFNRIDSSQIEPVTLAVVFTQTKITPANERKMKDWLQTRIKANRLQLFIEVQ